MNSTNKLVIDKLLQSHEPSIRYKAMVNILGKKPETKAVKDIQAEICKSSRVKTLLSERDKSGRIPYHPYKKWYGAHWVLADLADIGYPKNDKSLIPLREQVLDWLLSASHWNGIKIIKGKTRRCCSQEGNAIYSLLKLGLDDERVDELVNRLIMWQWPDGGWNCDKNPQAGISSFHESILPMRALFAYAKKKRNKKAKQTALRASEIFLSRYLFKTHHDSSVMHADFIRLLYPSYWHYNVLLALRVFAEAGLIGDMRCSEALDLIESKRLTDGYFSAEFKKYRKVVEHKTSGASLVDWGGAGKTKPNEWVTVDVLAVLKAAGRL